MQQAVRHVRLTAVCAAKWQRGNRQACCERTSLCMGTSEMFSSSFYGHSKDSVDLYAIVPVEVDRSLMYTAVWILDEPVLRRWSGCSVSSPPSTAHLRSSRRQN